MCLALFIPLLLTACDDEGHRAFVALGEMEHESMRLDEQTTDSVLRFRTKFENFIAKYPNSKDDPRYETIVNNINDCLVTIPINIEIDGGADIMVD